MTTTTVHRLGEHDGQQVTLQGWLYNRRSKGKLHFLILRDGTGMVQCVAFRKEMEEADFARAGEASQEASLRVTGTVREDARAPGGYELALEAVEILQNPTLDYPLGKKDHGPDFLLQHRHLWLRSRRPWATLRIRHEIISAIREFLDARGFINVDTPIFTPAACEGTTTLFQVPYGEDMTAYLTQSGQLYNEAGCMSFGKVYCFGPTFRAERSKTRRHLTEFWMVEPEMAYADLEEVMDTAEEMVEYLVARVLERRQAELALLERDPTPLEQVRRPFPRITYDEAAAIIQEEHPDFRVGDDLGAPHETTLGERFQKPVLVHRWPRDTKAFYMAPDPANPDLVLGVDMIAPEGKGEIIGGGQRAESLEYLEEQIQAHGLPEEAFQWYLDLRRFGSVPHGGFGLGLERTVGWICGLDHIRECIPFPRTIYRITP